MATTITHLHDETTIEARFHGYDLRPPKLVRWEREEGREEGREERGVADRPGLVVGFRRADGLLDFDPA